MKPPFGPRAENCSARTSATATRVAPSRVRGIWRSGVVGAAAFDDADETGNRRIPKGDGELFRPPHRIIENICKINMLVVWIGVNS